jgi:hypothetical protein
LFPRFVARMVIFTVKNLGSSWHPKPTLSIKSWGPRPWRTKGFCGQSIFSFLFGLGCHEEQSSLSFYFLILSMLMVIRK